MLELKDPALLRSQGLIDERWQDADDGTTRTVVDPADRLSIATVLRMKCARSYRPMSTQWR